MTDHIERTKEQIAVMQAYVDGDKIDFKETGSRRWVNVDVPYWGWCLGEYRIRQTPDSIDWTHVAPEFKWMKRDANGGAWLYSHEPNGATYISEPFKVTRASCFTSYRKGTVDWKDSLVKRPEGE